MWVLAAIFPTKQANSRCFLEKKTLRAALFMIELQSVELRIQQNLKPKIKLVYLTTKMHLIDL